MTPPMIVFSDTLSPRSYIIGAPMMQAHTLRSWSRNSSLTMASAFRWSPTSPTTSAKRSTCATVSHASPWLDILSPATRGYPVSESARIPRQVMTVSLMAFLLNVAGTWDSFTKKAKTISSSSQRAFWTIYPLETSVQEDYSAAFDTVATRAQWSETPHSMRTSETAYVGVEKSPSTIRESGPARCRTGSRDDVYKCGTLSLYFAASIENISPPRGVLKSPEKTSSPAASSFLRSAAMCSRCKSLALPSGVHVKCVVAMRNSVPSFSTSEMSSARFILLYVSTLPKNDSGRWAGSPT